VPLGSGPNPGLAIERGGKLSRSGHRLEVLGAWLDAILAIVFDADDIAEVIARCPRPTYERARGVQGDRPARAFARAFPGLLERRRQGLVLVDALLVPTWRGSAWQNRGVPEGLVADLVGHKLASITGARYCTAAEARRKLLPEAVAKLAYPRALSEHRDCRLFRRVRQ
jgi:hypothetical protein